MRRTFHIDDSKKGAKELLAYLRSLDFVKEEDKLTEEQYETLEKRKTRYLGGKSKTLRYRKSKLLSEKAPSEFDDYRRSSAGAV